MVLPGVSADCTHPNLDPCKTGDTCGSVGASGEWTFSDGKLIGSPANSTSNPDLASLKTNCFCQLTTRAGGVSTDTSVYGKGYILVTQCGGVDYGPVGGLNYWWDGKRVMASGYRPSTSNVFDGYTFMKCSTDKIALLQTSTSPEVFISWNSPQPNIEAPLVSGAVSNPVGLCAGYAIDAGDSNANTVAVAAIAGAPVNCTVDTTVITGHSDGSASQFSPHKFNTVCNSQGTVYWNGAGYRKPRHQNDAAGHSLDDNVSVGFQLGNTLLAYVTPSSNGKTATTTANGSTGTGNSSNKGSGGGRLEVASLLSLIIVALGLFMV